MLKLEIAIREKLNFIFLGSSMFETYIVSNLYCKPKEERKSKLTKFLQKF